MRPYHVDVCNCSYDQMAYIDSTSVPVLTKPDETLPYQTKESTPSEDSGVVLIIVGRVRTLDPISRQAICKYWARLLLRCDWIDSKGRNEWAGGGRSIKKKYSQGGKVV